MSLAERIRRGLASRLARADWLTLAIAGIAAAGIALALFRQSSYGVRVNGDAIHFIAMARSLLQGDGLLSWDGEYYGQWGPLAPISFAVFGLGLADPYSVAGPLNAAAFGLSVFVAGIWLRRRVKSRRLVIWACACMVLAFPVVEMSAWAYSEPGFILTGTLALFFADRHFENGKRSSLILSAAFCGLHCASRYMGIALLFSVVALLAFRRGVPLRRRLPRAAAYAIIGGAPLVAWALRNNATVGFYLRYQDASDTMVWEWIVPMMESLSGWWTPFVPLSVPAGVGAGAAMAALAVVGALTLFALVRWLRREGDGRRFFLLTAGFSFVYMALLLWGMTTGVDSNGMGRFAAPLFIPMAMAAAFLLDRAIARPPSGSAFGARRSDLVSRALSAVDRARAGAWLAPSVMLALALWAAYGGVVSARHHWREWRAAGDEYRGWTAPPWTESQTLAYTRGRADGGMVFSNVARMTYIASDQSAVYRNVPEGGAENLISALADRDGAPGETLVAWFHHYTPFILEKYPYNATTLRTLDGLEPIASLYDGDVFRLNPNYKAADMPSGDTPAASSRFDVYAEGGALVYERAPCAPSDVDARFFVRTLPVDLSDLPRESAADGYGDLDFAFWRYGAMLDGERCVIRRPLPEYALRGVEVGQWIIGGETVWSAVVEFPPDDAALAHYRDAYDRTAAARETAARSEYDVYLKDNALIYLKDNCEDSHTRGRFLLSAFPKNAKDIPEDRREAEGHISLNFDFARYGVKFDGKCLIRRPLPEYPITRAETGRWIPGEREAWRVVVAVGD